MSSVTVAAARRIHFAQHHRDGVLTVFEGNHAAGVPFPVARVFAISSVSAGGTRGHHAHRACSQVMVCLAGRADVLVDDGHDTSTITLDTVGTGLLIPPGLWNVVTFAGPDTVVAVFCDRPFEEHDYIRSREEFLRESGRVKDPSNAGRRVSPPRSA